MPLPSMFPTDPTVILEPGVRWYPGDQGVLEGFREELLPPLVQAVREGVRTWRASGYEGASATSVALLKHWFEGDHGVVQANEAVAPFRYYFAQREAVEAAVWLFEVEQARSPYALLKYDATGRVSKGMFAADWTRYVMKLATGAGKTKIMSLLMAWSYFHKLYEEGSSLSTNFLLIAPNIIVLDRLLLDFDGLRVFYDDPVIPPNGYAGQNWEDDFTLTLHVQDDVGTVTDTGNLFLTNIHRVHEGEGEPSFEDVDTRSYFLGPRPVGKSTDSTVDLAAIVREVPDLVVLNDEAHHVRPGSAWLSAIEGIALNLRQRGGDLAAQFDLTATPRHENGASFVETISDYPLVEAIHQGVTKTPVLPDAESRLKLQERPSDDYAARYEDYIHLGYLEWRKVFEELEPMGKKPILFVMTEDTKESDRVAEFLEGRYPDLKDRVLVIHTNRSGEIAESATSGKSKKELDKLRKLAREIDDPSTPYRAVVSVMVLKEGWDVQNVVSIVGLRPYTATARILPEQTLGRGLRRMFRGQPVQEKVSVVGTDGFMDFVESVKAEGVTFEYEPMGETTRAKSPLVIEVDRDDKGKDIAALDIELPILSPRIVRDYKDLHELDVHALAHKRLALRTYSAAELREIVFRDMGSEQVSHTTVLTSDSEATPQSVVGFYARQLMRDLRLVSGFDVLYGKVKEFIEEELFTAGTPEQPLALEEKVVLRNLTEIEAARTILETLKGGVNALTVRDRGATEMREFLRMSATRPFLVQDQPFLVPKRSLFNKVVGDSHFELEFAAFLESTDVQAYVKNSQATGFKIEYQNEDGSVANYIPDFAAKRSAKEVWIIETKGREDLDDPRKWARLKEWVTDATRLGGGVAYKALLVRQETWDKHKPKTFADLIAACSE